MEKTSIEYFNDQLKYFVKDIYNTFPEYKEVLVDYYSEILENDSCNSDKYVKRYMRKTREFKTLISNKDSALFNDSICILKNVDFKTIWESEELSDSNKEHMWEYIQTLFVLGETIISDSDKIKNLVKNFQKFRSSTEGETADGAEEETTEEDAEILDMLKNLSERNEGKPIDENIFENGLIGKLAQELSQELNLDELNLNVDQSENVDDIFNNLVNGDNPMKFMNLLQTVGQKIQSKVNSEELDQSKLVEEATQLMSNLQGGNSMFDSLLRQATQGGGSMIPQNLQSEINNPHSSSSNSTRDRLRRKLEKRRQEQNK